MGHDEITESGHDRSQDKSVASFNYAGTASDTTLHNRTESQVQSYIGYTGSNMRLDGMYVHPQPVRAASTLNNALEIYKGNNVAVPYSGEYRHVSEAYRGSYDAAPYNGQQGHAPNVYGGAYNAAPYGGEYRHIPEAYRGNYNAVPHSGEYGHAQSRIAPDVQFNTYNAEGVSVSTWPLNNSGSMESYQRTGTTTDHVSSGYNMSTSTPFYAANDITVTRTSDHAQTGNLSTATYNANSNYGYQHSPSTTTGYIKADSVGSIPASGRQRQQYTAPYPMNYNSHLYGAPQSYPMSSSYVTSLPNATATGAYPSYESTMANPSFLPGTRGHQTYGTSVGDARSSTSNPHTPQQ